MFLHIGKDIIVNYKDIIAIFNIETIKNSKYFENFYKSLCVENIYDINEENRKTLILVRENEKVKGYISNISSNTLLKRQIKD